MSGKTGATPKRTAGGILLLIVLIAAAFFAFKAFGGSGSTSYSTTVQDYNSVNPADLAVTFQVTNTGKKAGTPECTVQAQDPTYTYHGVNIGKLTAPIQPGETKTTVMDLTITQEGASFISKATVKCS